MELHSICCCSRHLRYHDTRFSASLQSRRKGKSRIPSGHPDSSTALFRSNVEWRNGRVHVGRTVKWYRVRVSSYEKLPMSIMGIFNSPNINSVADVGSPKNGVDATFGSSGNIFIDSFHGKSGSVSFCGLNYQVIEGRQLVSSPFKEGTGSFLWILGPLALISSLVLPQFFLPSTLEVILKDEILAEIVASFSSEAIFYIGLAMFLVLTEHIQRPYLEYSQKQWGLISGLRGYLLSAFFTMGFKVLVPLLAAYVVWPVIGLPALVAVVPFVLGCAAQFAFEAYIDKRKSSCWPILPIVFEVYRLYQLNKGAHLIERLILSMSGSAVSPELLERSSALFSMLAVFQVLGIVCLWSLATFLLRLFPSRPVAENY